MVGLMVGAVLPASAVETAMWGFTPGRNMVNDAKNLPSSWNVKTGENILWTAKLGSQTYGGPLIIGGKIIVGTNNQGARNPKIVGDKGVIMAFSQADGSFLWQLTHDKLTAGRVNDWPQQGICSTPAVEGNRLWYTSNQATIVSLDTEGFADGHAGPVTDEEHTGPTDGDVVWEYDMMAELDVFPPNLAV
ncbi:MAG: hypothetical protein IH850_10885, partial [Acidobacteria bacterium]|nr:hypothetical protein [Acidobacteriota bacterium]